MTHDKSSLSSNESWMKRSAQPDLRLQVLEAALFPEREAFGHFGCWSQTRRRG